MVVRENGNFDVIKQFILAGYPVLIETGYDPEPETVGWTSHYMTIVGFSVEDQGFIAMDTYRRPNWFYPYDEIDLFWRQFNRRYLIVHRPDQAVAVASIIGEKGKVHCTRELCDRAGGGGSWRLRTPKMRPPTNANTRCNRLPLTTYKGEPIM